MQPLTDGRISEEEREPRPAEPGRAAPRPLATPAGPPEVSLLRVVNIVIRRRGLVLATTLCAMVLVGTLTLLAPRTYTATAQFMPAARRMPSNLSGLAAQFGVALPGAEPGQSPPFYVDLIGSRGILKRLADTTFAGGGGTAGGPRRSAPLSQWYRIQAPDPEQRREAVIGRLRRDVSARAAGGTGVITLKARAPDPVLAEQMASSVLELLDGFNRENRKSQAASEREFTGRRLETVRAELRLAEDRLQRFLERNQGFQEAPSLRLEEERLRRELGLRQQLFSSLSQSYEQSRIEEVRDTPLLTVVERPDVPVHPDARYLILKVVLAGAFGLLLGVLLAVFREYLADGARDGARDRREFAALRGELLADLRHPLRAVGRPFARRGIDG